ncbi:MAG: hypothetical protein QXT69_02485 [Fervidicoccaceae archaeon]
MSAEDIDGEECREIGYLRICGGFNENILPELSLSRYLRRIADCLDQGKCSKGFTLVGGKNRKIVYSSPEKFSFLLSEIFGSNLEPAAAKKGYLLLQESLSSKEVFQKLGEDIGKKIDLVSLEGGVHLGVLVKEDTVIVSKIHGIKNNGSFLLPYEEISSLIPFTAAYSFHIIKAYRKLTYSVELVPKFGPTCIFKGEKLECPRYMGSSRCPFNRGIVCPLRTIHRRSREKPFGGILSYLDAAEKELKKIGTGRIFPLDRFVSLFILKYMTSLTYSLSFALKEHATFSSWKNDAVIASANIEEAEALTNEVQNYRLRAFSRAMLEELREMIQSNPSQRKTRIIISLDSLPQKLRLLSRYVENDRIYSICRPAEVSASVIDGYIRSFFPLLKGELSKIVSEKISISLRLNGCIEAGDISSILGEGLAENLLNTLHLKNLLQKRRGSHSNIYFLG